MQAKNNFKDFIKYYIATHTQLEISTSKLLGILILTYTIFATFLLNSQQNTSSLTYMVNISWGSFIAFMFMYKMPRFVPFVFYMVWSVVVSTAYRHVS